MDTNSCYLVTVIHHFNTLFSILLGSRTMEMVTCVLKSLNCVDAEAKSEGIL